MESDMHGIDFQRGEQNNSLTEIEVEFIAKTSQGDRLFKYEAKLGPRRILSELVNKDWTMLASGDEIGNCLKQILVDINYGKNWTPTDLLFAAQNWIDGYTTGLNTRRA
jgi:hypothetical protein